MAFCTSQLLPTRKGYSGCESATRCSADGPGRGDLVVVGAGALGMRVAHLWRSLHPESEIVCATASGSRHEQISEAGFVPALASKLHRQAARVVFCAPPSGLPSAQYAACVSNAAGIAKHRFVFTSATSVFADAEVVTERSALSESPRAGRLLSAENVALARGNGVVLRLGGLYSLERGPHSVWLRRGEVSGGPEGMLNMVHYDDVAQATVRALEAEAEDAVGNRFVIVDGEPVTREELLHAARSHPMYEGFEMPRFGNGGRKKRIDGSWSAEKLKWEPRYKSFVQFMQNEQVLCDSGTA